MTQIDKDKKITLIRCVLVNTAGLMLVGSVAMFLRPEIVGFDSQTGILVGSVLGLVGAVDLGLAYFMPILMKKQP